MKILLAAKHHPEGRLKIGGVQSWMTTLAAEFRKMGHDATIWSPEFVRPKGPFDVGILSNASHTRCMAPQCAKVLGVSHGIIPDEKPIHGLSYAFTSEGVKRHWGGSGPVLRQPIDLGFWWQAEGTREGVVRFSYRAGLPFLESLCRDMGHSFKHVKSATPVQAREALHKAACVLATGRAAVEAMACGAPVAICDERNYQGPLVAYSIPSQMAENYSGRGGVVATRETVKAAIENAIRAGSQRRHVEAHHDSRKIAEQILCLLS